MQQDTPFDRRLRRLRRDRAARLPSERADLMRLATDEIIDRLDLIKRDFHEALDLCAGDAMLAAELRRRGMKVACSDPGFAFARECGGVQCDEDLLPFASESFDLIVSAGGLDTINDLPGALALIRRALRPDGLFLAVFVAAGSLPRLREAMLAADLAETGSAAPRIHPQIDVRAAGDLLSRAGFALPVADSHDLTLRYGSLQQQVRDLRALAGTNILATRSPRPILRSGLAAALSHFSDASDEDGRTGEQIQIVCLTAWAPAPDQPRPAKRGSGTVSLAAALRPLAKD